MRIMLGSLALVALAGCSDEAETVDEPNTTEMTGRIAETEESDDAEPAEEVATEEVSAKKVACGDGEDTIFTCKVGNGKRISVCGADGTAEYRYGRDTPELTLTAKQFASVPYSGGGELQIAFDNGPTRYIVFSRVVRTNFEPGEGNSPIFSDGVIVQRGEEVLNLQVCANPGENSIDYDLADTYLDEADELFSYQTERGDPSGEGGM